LVLILELVTLTCAVREKLVIKRVISCNRVFRAICSLWQLLLHRGVNNIEEHCFKALPYYQEEPGRHML